MATAIRTIGHDERLSLVDHLDELRTRLFVCLAALVVAFGFCFWQNHAILNLINKPLTHQTSKQVAKGEGINGQAAITQQALLGVVSSNQKLFAAMAADQSLSPQLRAAAAATAVADQKAVARIPRTPTGDQPVTLGVGEPFTTTLSVTLVFAAILALPIILFELYGFILPAFSAEEKRIAMPLMLAVPFLFVIGVAFGYFVVLPAAVRFFQNFNSGQFNILVQANQYYKFAGTILLAMGLVFQTPVAILGATRAGVVSHRTLAKNRRYAIVVCAAIAAFLPGDVITLLLETVPLYLLFEVSILLAAIFARRDAKREAREAQEREATMAAMATTPSPTPETPVTSSQMTTEPINPSVQQIIDHVDDNLSD
jgi:sec-independent protein translocase protein TatC